MDPNDILPQELSIQIKGGKHKHKEKKKDKTK